MSKPNVLILCTGNSARSQMAEGLMRKHAGHLFDAYSAGTSPKPINPLAVRAMAEIGFDISGHRSKDIAEYLGRLPVRHLLVVCSNAQSSCPTVWPGVLTRTYWDLPDPAAAAGTDEEKLEVFRESRDDLEARIVKWLADMGIESQAAK